MKKDLAAIFATLLLSIFLFTLTLSNTLPSDAQNELSDLPAELFSPAPSSVRINPRAGDTVRSRAAALDWDGLSSFATRIGTRVTLNLFDDAVFVARTRGREAHLFARDGYTWVADIEGQPYGEAILTIANGHAEGYVSASGVLYRITTTDNGLTEIRQLAVEQRLLTDAVLTRSVSAAQRQQTELGATCIPSIASLIIDAMVVYTPASRDAFGGTNAIINGIHAMTAATNLSYARSGVRQRLRLVYIGETNYTASGNAYQDLRRVTNSNSDGSLITGPDGFMDDVPITRNAVNADVVTAIVEINQPNGVGWQMLAFDAVPNSPFSEFAYNMIGSNLIVGGLGYAHELGHIMGNTHNVEDTVTFGACIDSFGYRDPGYFRTIMSYNCVSPTLPCPLINIWSDPALNYNGRSTGNALSNEVKTLNFTAPIVANFRVSSVTVTPTPVPPLVANDWWTAATEITTVPFGATQDIAGATISSDPLIGCMSGNKTNGVWYSYVPPNNQVVVLTTNGSAYDTGIGIYTIAQNGFNSVGCNDDVSAGLRTTSALSVSLNAGIRYYIIVSAKSAIPITTPTTLGLTINLAAAASTELIVNGDFGTPSTGNPNLPNGWGVFASPTIDDMEYRLSGGIFEFLRETTATSAVVLQNTLAWLPSNAPIEIRMRLGNSSTTRKRVTVLAHAADFSDLQVCTFWLEPNAPLRQYVMRTFTNIPWMPATVSIYASVADGVGWYQVDDVSLTYQPTMSVTSTQCTDPTAPPATTSDPTELLANGAFSSGLTNWGLFTSPGPTTDDDMVYRVERGVFEYYRRIRADGQSNSAVILQDSGDPMISGDVIQAQFSLGNSSNFRKRITVLLHANDFSDLQACTFWLAPNSALAVFTMRTFTTQAWRSATISFYASTADSAEWARIDNVSLKRLPNVALGGTACYIGGASPSGIAAFDAPIPPTLEATATLTYAQLGAPPEIGAIIATPTPTLSIDSAEGSTTE
ncbi:MAG: M12 family metallo-peptidase [Chloroflexota bacterium]|nr:M12 family metallo-peptidase [Chloroflexota bacterium]